MKWLPVSAEENRRRVRLLACAVVLPLLAVSCAPSSPPTPEPPRVSTLAAGEYHTCAVTAAGGVKCWGANGYGVLGTPSVEVSTTPVDVVGLGAAVSSVAAGAGHTCALTASGAVKCWGDNSFGQLGDADAVGGATPVDVPGLGSGVVAISAGQVHTCALTAGGAVRCWGDDSGGQLGDGPVVGGVGPVTVVGLGSGVTAVSAGPYHTCAATSGGSAKCWGVNNSGQLGDGSMASSDTPIDVVALSGVVEVAAGGAMTCARTTAGSIKCWGSNLYGQLGDGSFTDSASPVAVAGITGAAGVSAGLRHVCAVLRSGSIKCWGLNGLGELGDGQGLTIDRSATPVDVVGTLPFGTLAAEVDVGWTHTCAKTSLGRITCWGDNFWGQLGNGTNDNSYVADAVEGF